MSEIKRTLEWFQQAMPGPTDEQKCIQIGCHFEEVDEMLQATGFIGELVDDVSSDLKKARSYTVDGLINQVNGNETELLDSLVDQIVTAIGVCHTMGFDLEGALAEVNRSNFSKFENGKAVFDENGKITKGEHYSKPDLKPYI